VPNNSQWAETGQRTKREWSLARRSFIGGSDARIIMGNDEAKLSGLWQEKRGEVEPQDLSQDLVAQLGTITENLNRTWYERCSGHLVEDVQRRVRHPVRKWMGATLDGRVQQTGAVFEAKFMLLGIFPKKRRRRSTWPNCSTTWG
jgi:predicted phage-related endonuclease